LLSPAAQARLRGLDEIEKLKSDIRLLQESLRKELDQAQKIKKEYENQYADFLKERDQQLNKTVRLAERKVDEAIQSAKAEDVLRRHRELIQIKTQLPEIIKARPADANSFIDSVEKFALQFPAGSKVYVSSLKSDGLVQSLPNAKGEISVLAGSVRLQVHWKDLQPPHRPKNPTADLIRHSGSFSIALTNSEITVDLRGQSAEDAIEELENSLDRSLQAKQERIKIIHGHGTETLKRAVRSYLSRSIYVKKWKAGTPQNGGDGVTWVEIGDN
jgi:DNA mismatch repair protein MutS2